MSPETQASSQVNAPNTATTCSTTMQQPDPLEWVSTWFISLKILWIITIHISSDIKSILDYQSTPKWMRTTKTWKTTDQTWFRVILIPLTKGQRQWAGTRKFRNSIRLYLRPFKLADQIFIRSLIRVQATSQHQTSLVPPTSTRIVTHNNVFSH